jgi:hypothetical protein
LNLCNYDANQSTWLLHLVVYIRLINLSGLICTHTAREMFCMLHTISYINSEALLNRGECDEERDYQ